MRVVLAHGCWDILHPGHLHLLRMARDMGDRLVVSVLADRLVARAKGEARPIHKLSARMDMLRSLRFVDQVVSVNAQGTEGVARMIREVRPDIYVKGTEYQDRNPDHEICKELGIQVRYIPMLKVKGYVSSTTRLMGTLVHEYITAP